MAYDNTTSGLSATDVKAALDELAASGGGGGGGAGQGGSWLFVEEYTLTSGSDLDVPLPDYDHIKLEILSVPGTDGNRLDAQVTDDNFSTVKSGASDYEWATGRLNPTGTGWANNEDSADTLIRVVHGGAGSAADEFTHATMYVYGANDSALKTVTRTEGVRINNTGNSNLDACVGQYNSTGVVNGIRFLTGSTGSTLVVRVYRPVRSSADFGNIIGGEWKYVESFQASGGTIDVLGRPAGNIKSSAGGSSTKTTVKN